MPWPPTIHWWHPDRMPVSRECTFCQIKECSDKPVIGAFLQWRHRWSQSWSLLPHPERNPIYCPRSFSRGGLYCNGNRWLLWSVIGDWYGVWLVTVIMVCVVTVMLLIWLLLWIRVGYCCALGPKSGLEATWSHVLAVTVMMVWVLV